MEDLWGISGPRFLGIYLGLLIAPVVAGVLLRKWQQNRMRPDGPQRPGLTVYHLAYLAGGPQRAVAAAVAALIETALLRVDSRGTLYRISGYEPADPFERAVLQQAPGRTVVSLTPGLRRATAWLSEDLAARGLALAARFVVRYRVTIAVVYVAIAAFGLVRVQAGVKVHHPVVNLVLGVVAAGVLAALWAWLAVQGKRDFPSAAGQELVRQAQNSRGNPVGPAGLVLVGCAGLVALGGVLAFPDPAIAAALAYTAPVGSDSSSSCGSSCSSSSCSSSSCSSSSSCGGGSSCSSGCGG